MIIRHPSRALATRLRLRTALCGVALLGLPYGLAWAGPEGGVVSGGNATISQAGAVTTINQVSDRALIDWSSFNVASHEQVSFLQPGAHAIAINRIHDANPSVIQGQLGANGQVMLINPNGVVFGAGAQVDVNGLVVSTASPTERDAQDFVSGRRSDLPLSVAGRPDSRIVNHGHITAQDAGLVGFIAPNLVNQGVIVANGGTVHLAAGSTATVDLYGDGLVDLAIAPEVQRQLIDQGGLIQADGGKVILSAAAGRQIVDSVINMDGLIQAQSVSQKNGKIILQGHDNTTVRINGRLDASGRTTGQHGGTVTVTGRHIDVQAHAAFDASGHTGGGTIKIGGDYQGQGDLLHAQTVTIDRNATITSDALASGPGGTIILWSDDHTWFAGTLTARGITGGGMVETSGKRDLTVTGHVDLSSASGQFGTWLLDPTNITIYNRSQSGTDNVNSVTTAYLESQNANINLTADNTITLDLTGDTLALSPGRSLTLTATSGDIVTASDGTITTDNGAITFMAGGAITLSHALDITLTNGGVFTATSVGDMTLSDITTQGGTITATVTGNGNSLTTNRLAADIQGDITLTADQMALNGTISGTDTLTIQPHSPTVAMRFNVGGPGLNIDSSELARLQDGWSLIQISRPDSSGGLIMNSTTWHDSVVFRNNSLREIYGTLTATGDASVTFLNGATNLFSTIATDTGDILFTSNTATDLTDGLDAGRLFNVGGSLTTQGGAITFERFIPATGTMTINSLGGDIRFTKVIDRSYSTSNVNLILNAGSGQLRFDNTVNGIFGGGVLNLTAMAGHFMFTGAWGGTEPLGHVSITSIDSLSLPTLSAQSLFARTIGTTADLTLGASTVLTTTGINGITLVAARHLINQNTGTSLITGSNGRWLIYSANPTGTTGEQYLSHDFNRYSCTYGGGSCGVTVPTLGNGLIYAYTPFLDVTPDAQTIIYGDNATLSGYSYTVSGYLGDDGDDDSITGTLTATSSYVAGSDIGQYDIAYHAGMLASQLGYGFTYNDRTNGLTVGTKTLTPALTGSVTKTFDGSALATLAANNYTLGSGVFSNDDVHLNNPVSGAYNDATVGTNKTITVAGLSLSGTKAHNYTLSTTSISGLIGAILAAPVSTPSVTPAILPPSIQPVQAITASLPHLNSSPATQIPNDMMPPTPPQPESRKDRALRSLKGLVALSPRLQILLGFDGM